MAIRAALSCRGPSAPWAGGWSQTARRGGAVLTGGYPPGKRAHSQEEAPGPAFICKAAETPLKWAGSGLEVAPAAHPEKSGEGATEGSGPQRAAGCGPAAGAPGARGTACTGTGGSHVPRLLFWALGQGRCQPRGSPRVVCSPRSVAPRGGSSLLNPAS